MKLSCPSCDCAEVTSETVIDSFIYGDAMLSATISVYTCKGCGLSFCNDSASVARDAAVLKYFRGLTEVK